MASYTNAVDSVASSTSVKDPVVSYIYWEPLWPRICVGDPVASYTYAGVPMLPIPVMGIL